jgi:hypothetical protein
VPQLSYHILHVCLDVPHLVHAAGMTPSELLDDIIDDILYYAVASLIQLHL